MANEATFRTSLQITKGNLNYQSQPTAFSGNVSASRGPVPGFLVIPTTGLDISFTGLTTPAYCWMQNLDTTNFVTYGIYDPDTAEFYPLGEILPGEFYTLRISRQLGLEYGTGAGSTGSGTTLRFKADTASVNVRIDCFDS
jgi:hypothetical protein